MNRVCIVATKFQSLAKNEGVETDEPAFGYRAYDDDAQVYFDILSEEEASLPDLEFLKLAVSEDYLSKELVPLIRFVKESETGIYVNGRWYLWEEVRDILSEE